LGLVGYLLGFYAFSLGEWAIALAFLGIVLSFLPIWLYSKLVVSHRLDVEIVEILVMGS
jgi:positive regulator of sigma E activity